MAKVAKETEDERVEGRILTALSMDSRMGIDGIAEYAGLTRDQARGRVRHLVDAYGIRFVPEINLRSLQKYEYLGLSWGKSKREMLRMLTDGANFSIGFEEYIALVEFKKGEPTNAEILKATEGSYIPQYIARMSGHCNLMIYAVARNSTEISRFMYRFMNNLGKFNSTVRLQFIFSTFGYFPVNDKLIGQMQINARYKELLLALNADAKVEFKSLTEEMGNVTGATVGVTYARLREMELLKRPTICITKQVEPLIELFTLSLVDREKFLKNRDKMLLDFVRVKIKHYVFMADISNPDGALIIARFKSALEAENFKKDFGTLDMGVEVEESTILQDIYGNLGIRNFIPEETLQYKELAAKSLISNTEKRGAKKERASTARSASSKASVKFDFANLSESSS